MQKEKASKERKILKRENQNFILKEKQNKTEALKIIKRQKEKDKLQ